MVTYFILLIKNSFLPQLLSFLETVLKIFSPQQTKVLVYHAEEGNTDWGTNSSGLLGADVLMDSCHVLYFCNKFLLSVTFLKFLC